MVITKPPRLLFSERQASGDRSELSFEFAQLTYDGGSDSIGDFGLKMAYLPTYHLNCFLILLSGWTEEFACIRCALPMGTSY